MSLPWAWLQTNIFPHYFAPAILLDKGICRWTKQYVVLLLFSTEIWSSDGYGVVYLPRKEKIIRLTVCPNKIIANNMS